MYKLLLSLFFLFPLLAFTQVKPQNARQDTAKKKAIKLLDTVVITGNKPVIRKEYDKLIFSVENSPLRDAVNGLELLSRIPKLQVTSQGDILMRSQSPLILINGRKLNLSGEDLSAYLRNLDPKRIKSIEIQDMGAGDTDAQNSGGVINIIMKGAPQGFSSTLTNAYTYRKNKVWSGSTGLTANYGFEKWNFFTRTNYEKNNDAGSYAIKKIFPAVKGQNLSLGDFSGLKHNLALQGGAIFTPSKNQELGAEVYYNHSDSQGQGREDLRIFDPELSSVSTNITDQQSGKKLWYTAFNYTYKTDTMGSQLKVIADIGGIDASDNNTTNSIYPFASSSDNSYRYLTVPISHYYTLQGDWLQKLSKKQEFKTGVKYGAVDRSNTLESSLFQNNSWILTPEGQEDFDNKEDVLAGYFTFSSKLGNQQNFRLGLRAEYTHLKGENHINEEKVNQDYTNLFPSFYYGYTLQNTTTLSASFSRHITRPSFRDLNPFLKKENDFSYISGNPNLLPQYSNQYELSWQLKKQSVSLYANYFEDVIAGVYRNEGNVTYYQPQNFGKQRQLGIDYNYYGNVYKWLYTNISSGLFYTKFDLSPLHPSKYSFQNNLYTRITLPKDYAVDIYNNFLSGFQQYMTSVGTIYTMDLALQKRLWHKKGTIKLSCNDVFNTSRSKNFSTYQNFDVDFYQKRVTRAYALLFSYTFSNHTKTANKSIQSDAEKRGRL